MVLDVSKSAILLVSRSFGRQIDLLPGGYLRQFFRIKIGDDISSVLSTPDTRGMRTKKLKMVKKELRRLEAANSGHTKAMSHILDLAYGRTGKLRWEIMKPLLTDPAAQLPQRIIPEVEKSRPPIYSPEVAALLTSPYSRSTKPLAKRALENPPTLPARADPNSEEAQLLGPFSKRREVNIRWRYFTTEIKKVLPPLQITLEQPSVLEGRRQMTDKDSLIRAGIRPLGLQDSGALEEALSIAGPAWTPPPKTRRERRSSEDQVYEPTPPTLRTHLPRRFIRRRYQQLLSKIPILTCTQNNTDKGTQGRAGRYSVSLAPSAVATVLRWRPDRLPIADSVDLAWVEQANQNLPSNAKQKS